MDEDIAKYLRENKPPKLTGKRYHQWLHEDRGVKALLEHMWTVIGLAKTCDTIDHLRYEINKNFSGNYFQNGLFSRKELSRLNQNPVKKKPLKPKDKKLRKWLKNGGREDSKKDFLSALIKIMEKELPE